MTPAMPQDLLSATEEDLMPTAPDRPTPHWPAPVRRVLGCALALFALLAALAVAAGPTQAAAPPHATPRLTTSGAPVLGDYATPLVGAPDANGVKHIDTAATIAKLTAAHINTYAYLIYGQSDWYGTASESLRSQAQWDDLPGFASAAAAAGIDVFVYLVPPTEATQTGYQPYGWDYAAWADAIATLAVSHTNIREIVVDDFGANTVEGGSTRAFAFTPSYVGTMMSSARAIAPWLKFDAVLYYPNIVGSGAGLPAYRSVIDGLVFPYRGAGSANTTDASAATQEGQAVGAQAKCQGGQHCLQFNLPKSTPTTAGDYVQVSQTVSVSNAATKSLSFFENDDFLAATSGYHYLQALIDGTVVWQGDVAASTDGLWHHPVVDVSSALAGKTSATLTFRLWDKAGVSNFHVAALVDDVSGTGFTVSDGGFENTSLSPWTTSTNTTKFTTAVVPSLSRFFMTYTSKFSSEPNPVTTTYVNSVVSQALDLITNGSADGSLLYTLNLTGQADGRSDPAVYDVIADLYGGYTG